jgi:hypothetical protein
MASSGGKLDSLPQKPFQLLISAAITTVPNARSMAILTTLSTFSNQSTRSAALKDHCEAEAQAFEASTPFSSSSLSTTTHVPLLPNFKYHSMIRTVPASRSSMPAEVDEGKSSILD